MARGATPRDRFDDVPLDLARVGAHRAPVRRRGLRTFAWAALATGVLVGLGVLGLGEIENRVTAPADAGTTSVSSAGPKPTVDAAADVVVLNATSTTGLAANAATRARAAGWNVTSTANADTTGVKLSTVYYSQSSQLGAALGLAKSLGIGRAPVKSDRYDVKGQQRLTVVLGADFTKAA